MDRGLAPSAPLERSSVCGFWKFPLAPMHFHPEYASSRTPGKGYLVSPGRLEEVVLFLPLPHYLLLLQ